MYEHNSQSKDDDQSNNQRGISSKNFLNKLSDQKEKYGIRGSVDLRASQGSFKYSNYYRYSKLTRFPIPYKLSCN